MSRRVRTSLVVATVLLIGVATWLRAHDTRIGEILALFALVGIAGGFWGYIAWPQCRDPRTWMVWEGTKISPSRPLALILVGVVVAVAGIAALGLLRIIK